jgi:hypothetical protein
MKAEGAGDRKKMIKLCEYESKYSFLLLALVAIPLIAEMETILGLWLNEIPEHSVMFCRLILTASLCDLISIGWTTANQAIGKIKVYNIIFYTMKLLVIVIAWWCLKKDLPISSVMWSYVAIELLGSLLRLPLMKYISKIEIIPFFKNVFLRIIGPLLAMIIVCYLSVTHTEVSWRVVITFTTSIIIGLLTIWILALSDNEKQYIKNNIKQLRK